jgi:hypothetical protein
MSYKQRQTLAKARRAKLEKGAAVALVGAPSTSARVSVVDIGERELQRVDKRRREASAWLLPAAKQRRSDLPLPQ